MNAEQLFHVLSTIHPLTGDFKRAIEKELVHLSLPKNYLLLEAPRISEHAYFLEKGFAMCYTFVKGKKQIEWFWTSRQIIVSTKSFFEQVPAKEFIQLIEQSEVLCISYAGVLRLFDAYPEAHFIWRGVMNQYYERSRERIHDIQFADAEERYKKLLFDYPGIEQFIPQEYIATYLGITPQSLSRIKRKKI
jgi:CRP/FNR family transcriptional regulator, anaerobic regulatory protein